MSQPFSVAEVFTCILGKYVRLVDIVEKFLKLVLSDLDGVQEKIFYLKGSLGSINAVHA